MWYTKYLNLSELKILTVIGARPQFIKAATVSRVFGEKKVNEIIVHTGQHFDTNMSNVFFEEMDIPRPQYFLNIHGLSHGAMTGQMLEKVEEVIKKEIPDCVLVYGDTNSTLAGALAAVKLHVPVAHVEAGLRSFNMKMPEEINRILTDRISGWLYCPTQTAVNNLKKEGFDDFDCKILLSGDVMYDAALYYRQKASGLNTLSKFGLSTNGYFLCTIHRPENTDNVENLNQIIDTLNELNAQSEVVLPLHPRTRAILKKYNIPVNFKIVDPVGYLDMINLIAGAKTILTDSGGLQKEAYFFKKFCVTIREQTEWTELVEAGVNKVTGAHKNQILNAVQEFDGKKFGSERLLYGNGKAAYKIAEDIVNSVNVRK